MFDRATKLIAFASLAAAVMAEVHFVALRAHTLGTWGAAAFTIALVVSLVSEEAVAAALTATLLVVPSLLFLVRGAYSAEDTIVWTAALAGAILPRAVRRGWAVPRPWRAPLQLWALCLAVAWPIVVARESNFRGFEVLPITTSHVGIAAGTAIAWILGVATTSLAGILLFDWILGVFDASEARFRRAVVMPLLAGGAVAIGVALYQGYVNITFLNTGMFAFIQRASGTLRDANPFGAAAALWGAMAVAAIGLWPDQAGLKSCATDDVAGLKSCATDGPGRAVRAVLAVAALGASWAAVWASGSRTALIMAAVVAVSVAWQAWRASRRRAAVAATAVVITVILAASIGVAALAARQSVGPIARMTSLRAQSGGDMVRRVVHELWFRDGYGQAAALMIARHPFVGVGVGSFHIIVPDYSFVRPEVAYLIPDNAQNWFRHQAAELGALGSIGWLAWTVLFAWFLLRRRAPASRRFSAGVVAGGIVALAIASLAGMPAQNGAINVMFWVMAAWVTLLVRAPSDAPPGQLPKEASDEARMPPYVAVAVVAIVAAFGAGTLYAARHDLRPTMRAERFDWDYRAGLYPPDAQGFQIAGRYAAAVVAAPKPWMAITYYVNHYDLAQHPVALDIRAGDAHVTTMLRVVQPATAYVRVPAGHQRMLIETRVDRTIRPSDLGIPDRREIGLFIKWQPVDAPPQGATIWDEVAGHPRPSA